MVAIRTQVLHVPVASKHCEQVSEGHGRLMAPNTNVTEWMDGWNMCQLSIDSQATPCHSINVFPFFSTRINSLAGPCQ